jgi:hypothetical protein
MVRQVRHYLWRLLGAGLLFGLAVGAWCGSRWLAAEPGSSEDVFARIRVGMSQEEAVAVLRTYGPYKIDGVYSEGTTKQGHSWTRMHVCRDLYGDLPPPQEVVRCILTVCSEDGREVEVVLGPGGIVAAKRLSPGVWQYRLQETHRVVDRAASDLISGSWWRAQLHKTSRSLRHRRRYAVPCLAVVLVIVSAWVLQRRIITRTRSSIFSRFLSMGVPASSSSSRSSGILTSPSHSVQGRSPCIQDPKSKSVFGRPDHFLT